MLRSRLRGARVTATDLSPVQVRRGEARCERDGADVRWLVADAERLPFNAGEFDRVISAFGVIFAPRPEVAVAELFRVCRSGGIVGVSVWPDDSYMGQLSATFRATIEDESVFPEPDLGWGDEAVLRARLQAHASNVVVSRHTLRWDPAARAAAGSDDCAAAYFRSHVADELPRLAAARDRVDQRFETSDGLICAEYVVAVAYCDSGSITPDL